MHRQPHQSWQLLTTYLRPQRGRVAALAVLLLSSIGLQLINPQIVRYFIDRAVDQTQLDRDLISLAAIADLYIGVALLTQAVSVGATYLSEKVGWSATNSLRTDLALHCLKLDMPFHNLRTPGEMIERIDGDVLAISKFFSQFVIHIFGSALLMGGILIVLFWEDWRIGVAMTIFTLVTVIALTRVRHVAVPAMNADREVQAKLFGFLEERLAGLDDIRANGGGNYVMRRLYQDLREVFNWGRRGVMMSATISMVTMALFTLGYALSLGLGGYLYLRGAITIGTVYLFFDYVYLLQQPINQLSEQLKEFQKAMAGIQRVQELYRYTPQITDGAGPLLPSGPLEITFDNVSFAYPVVDRSQELEARNQETGDGSQPSQSPTSNTRHPIPDLVLRDLSLTLQPGHVLGLLGRTGSGKTTITRLLFRLYELDHGAIRLNGIDLRDARLADLRDRIGIVTQDVQLFQATVRNNLTLFDRSLPDARLIDVLQDLGLIGWYRTLPDGLDSLMEPRSLSAGEAQLLAFARVFLKDPGLVILDEASSRLDPATEQLIERAVDKLLRDRTGIIIAHRLATVQRADEILILDHGRIHEHGSRTDLASDPNSRFAQLLRTGDVAEVLT